MSQIINLVYSLYLSYCVQDKKGCIYICDMNQKSNMPGNIFQTWNYYKLVTFSRMWCDLFNIDQEKYTLKTYLYYTSLNNVKKKAPDMGWVALKACFQPHEGTSIFLSINYTVQCIFYLCRIAMIRGWA